MVRHLRPKTVIRIVNERFSIAAHNRKRDGVLGWKRSAESRTGVPKIPAWLLLLQTKRISPMTNKRSV